MVMVPAPCCAAHGQVVDPAVLVEALVLGGEDGVLHHVGHVLDGHDRPPLLAEFAEQVAVGRDHPQGDLGLIVGDLVERRQCWPQKGQYEGREQAADHGEAEGQRDEIEEPAF